MRGGLQTRPAPRSHWVGRAAKLVVGLIVMAGCSSQHYGCAGTVTCSTSKAASSTSQSITTASTTSTTSRSSQTTTSASPSTDLKITEVDRGRTVTSALGSTILISLPTTYWVIDAVNGSVLLALGPQKPRGIPECRPGGGCGEVSQRFRVAQRGRVHITAHRNACGEALACGPGEGNFDVVIIAR